MEDELIKIQEKAIKEFRRLKQYLIKETDFDMYMIEKLKLVID